MKKLLLGFLPFMFFISCEDKEATSNEAGTNTIIGSWNFVGTEYDTTCTGNGEEFIQGTMVFSETDVVVTNNISFDNFCSDFDGVLINDTTCVSGGYFGSDTLTISFLHALCEMSDMDATDNGCSRTLTSSYTISDFLYINQTMPGYNDYECANEMGTYNETDSSCTFIDTVDIDINEDTATWSDVYIDEDSSDDSYCDVFVLTRQ